MRKSLSMLMLVVLLTDAGSALNGLFKTMTFQADAPYAAADHDKMMLELDPSNMASTG